MKTDRRHPHETVELGGRRATDIPFVFTETEWESHKEDDLRAFKEIRDSHKEINRILTDYIDKDMKWKDVNQPALDKLNNITGFSKIGLSTILTIGAVLEAINVIRGFLSHK